MELHDHRSFDATEELEVDEEVKPASTKGTQRALYIKGKMTETYGYTKACSKRVAKRAGMSVAKHTLPHAKSAWKKK